MAKPALVSLYENGTCFLFMLKNETYPQGVIVTPKGLFQVSTFGVLVVEVPNCVVPANNTRVVLFTTNVLYLCKLQD